MYTAKVFLGPKNKLIMLRIYNKQDLPFKTKRMVPQEIKRNIIKMVEDYVKAELIHAVESVFVEVAETTPEDQELSLNLSDFDNYIFKNLFRGK